MRRNRLFPLFLLLGYSIPLLRADVAAVKVSALPQETAVLAALDDVKQVEPYCQFWVAAKLWYFDIPRQQVADRLSKDLGFLVAASKAHPENAELTLLTAMVAIYAHNLELEGSYDTAMKMLAGVDKVAAGDLRIAWYRSTLHCQSTEIVEGATGFLAIESGTAREKLPVAFWDDYMECALLANMPQHVLRAASYLEKAHERQSDRGKAYVEIASKRVVPFDPTKDYEPSAVWLGPDPVNNVEVLTGESFGAQIKVPTQWGKEGFQLKGDTGTSEFLTGPYKAKKGNLQPSILLLVRQAKPGQTLENFAAGFDRDATFTAFAPVRCPAERCIAEIDVKAGAYHENGDGRGRLVFFERDQPEFPGLTFESPSQLPLKEGRAGPESFAFTPIQQRMPGRLFYLVVLDTAASIEEPALKDFSFFLENLTVE
jgi:hypothetical protein